MNTALAEQYTMKTECKRDAINLFILIIVAFALGVYLIASTVLISKDGVFYIEQARLLSSDPADAMRGNPPGYPFLILAAHSLVGLFGDNSSLFRWIYAAQGVTLLFRLLALVPLYLVGKQLVGSRKSFYALLVLILLPHPAKMACELTREWPYMLFLATGFLFLLWGARRGRWWAFGLAGLTTGLGYWIRPACIQLVIYGSMWLTLSMVWPRVGKMCRTKSLVAAASLFTGFAVVALPYVKCTGYIISPSATRIFKVISLEKPPNQTDMGTDDVSTISQYTAGVVPWKGVKALGEVFKTLGENLMWFFVPPLFVGLYCRLRYEAEHEEIFLMTIFILINLAMIVCRYCYLEVHMSNRWSFPLVAFTIFYICDGLQGVANWLPGVHRLDCFRRRPRLSSILLLIGVLICLPKLLRPAGTDKRGYRAAAKWLKENTDREDVIAVPDKRITLYAERKGLIYDKNIPQNAKYAVTIVKGKDEKLEIGRPVQKELALWLNEERKAKRIVLYKIL